MTRSRVAGAPSTFIRSKELLRRANVTPNTWSSRYERFPGLAPELQPEVAAADGRSILEGLAKKLWEVRWDDTLAALAIARELQDLLEDETDELAEDCIRAGASFEDVAVAYGISRQGARQRWAIGRPESGRRRPRPRARLGTHITDGEASFVFDVNKSFVRYNSPITIPKVCYRFFREHVGERDVTVVTPDGPNAGLGGLTVGDRVRVTTTASTQGVEVELEHVG